MARRINLTERKPLNIKIVCFCAIRSVIESILRVRKKPLYMSYWRLSLIQQNLFSWKQRRWIRRSSILNNGWWLRIDDIFTQFYESASQEKKVIIFVWNPSGNMNCLYCPFWGNIFKRRLRRETRIKEKNKKRIKDKKTYKLYGWKTENIWCEMSAEL